MAELQSTHPNKRLKCLVPSHYEQGRTVTVLIEEHITIYRHYHSPVLTWTGGNEDFI